MLSLLLVDDDEFVRSALTRALNRTGGFSVIGAEDGRRALDALGHQRVDAILTDLQMPVMDGLTLLAELFERGVQLPVAVMTGQQIGADLRQRLQAYGIAAIFSKPVDIVALADELQRVLDPQAVGRITGVTLFGLLQLLEVERKSGLVVVSSTQREGRLYFAQGALVHAQAGHRDGLEAAYEVLGWPDPAVEIFYKRRARLRTVDAPLQHVLMEAARLLDERGRPADHAPPAAEPAMGDADAILERVLAIEGTVGAALVQVASGTVLAQASRRRGFDLARAVRMMHALVQAALRLDEGAEDIIITVDAGYHLARFLGPTHDLFVHLVLDRERASLGMARQQLAKLARTLA